MSDERVLFIDSSCVFCDGFAIWLIPRLLEESRLKIAPIGGKLFSVHASENPAPSRDAIFLISSGELVHGAKAVLGLAPDMRSPYPVLASMARIVPAKIAEVVYDLVSRRRKKIWGTQDSCSLELKANSRFFD
jgi:predicted DCC family thiol-disulfide oxidoreductase YuxK